jgi:hypothetical protein
LRNNEFSANIVRSKRLYLGNRGGEIFSFT